MLKPKIYKNDLGYWDVRISVRDLFSQEAKSPAFISKWQAAQMFVWQLNRKEAYERI